MLALPGDKMERSVVETAGLLPENKHTEVSAKVSVFDQNTDNI